MKVLNSEQKKVNFYSNALMGLTSVHHLYGSIIYNTPWRAHVLFLSIPVIIVTMILSRSLQRNKNSYLFWIYWTTILVSSVIFIGLFEGLYNHVFKNILFFSGLPPNWMSTMYPPPIYEMPNDIFFEVTGILQGIIAIPLIRSFIGLTRLVIKRKQQLIFHSPQKTKV